MTLGNRIKSLRMAAGLSQPEFAEKAGIEQSYLSKLENDKSLPSNDIFRQLLSAFEISIESFMHGMDSSSDLGRLNQIADIEQWLNAKQQTRHRHFRQYLYVCSAMIIAAVTSFYVGYSKLMFSELAYVYESPGVVLEGEPKDIFRNWRRFIDPRAENHRDLVIEKELEINRRRDFESVTSHEYLGQEFKKQVKGGNRYFYLDRERGQRRLINAWLQVIGVMLLVTGLMGFVLERKLFK